MMRYRPGEPYPQLAALLDLRHVAETVQHRYSREGHELLLCYRGPTAREIGAVRRGAVELALFVDQSLVLLLYRFAGYNWYAAPARADLPVIAADRLLTVILIDAAKHTITALRSVELPADFATAFAAALQEQARHQDGAAELRERLRLLRAREGPDSTLVANALVRCEAMDAQTAASLRDTQPRPQDQPAAVESSPYAPSISEHPPQHALAAELASDLLAHEGSMATPQQPPMPSTTSSLAEGSLRAERKSEMPLEGPDEYITLARAAHLSGLSADTLRSQATRRGRKLQVVQLGPRALVTTRRWLHAYLISRDARGGHARWLPPTYVPPI